MTDTAALVLFSGGQDSTACLAWACERHARVETVGFAYGQRHAIELQARKTVLAEVKRAFPQWAARIGADHELELPTLAAISETSLTRAVAFEMSASGLPNTFVPGRNLLFFTYAAALGYRRGLHRLIGGMCETDFSGYPDCRDATLQSLAQTLRLGTEAAFEIETPLMWLTKAETWALTGKLGGDALVEIVREHTHTCYLGERGQRHAWGYGCTSCPACVLRAKGWEEWTAMTIKPGIAHDLTRAIDLALAGDWDGSHKIVQGYEDDATACWIHAVLHKIEGDADNSRYWYGQAARRYEDFADPKAELAAIRTALASAGR